MASAEHKLKARQFLDRFNTGEDNVGLSFGNVKGSDVGLKAIGGSTRLDLALSAAFLDNASTILIISDGAPRVQKSLNVNGKDKKAYRDRLARWREENKEAIQAYEEALAKAKFREVKVWIPPSPRREGKAAVEGHFEIQQIPLIQLTKPEPPPPPKERDWWTLEDFLEHLRLQLAKRKDPKPPVVHSIGYSIDDPGAEFLKAISKEYKGQYRRISKI